MRFSLSPMAGTLICCNKPACTKNSMNDCVILSTSTPMLKLHMTSANKDKLKSHKITHLELEFEGIQRTK